jgi:microcystin-dependent protein
MSDEPFLAEIALFPYGFVPTGWARCSGQLLPISQNTALFSLLGTNYGVDGKSTYALPNLNGSVAIGTEQGNGLTERFLGEASGTQTVALLESEIPAHIHNVQADTGPASSASPAAGLPATAESELYHSATNSSTPVKLVAPSGSSEPHNNMQPYLTLTYCIALQGIFPQRP